MSLSETREIMVELENIYILLNRIENTSNTLQRKLPEVTAVVISVQQALRLFWRLTSLMRKMGLPEDVENAIQSINALARAATYAYYAQHLLMMGTPYGYVAGAIGLVNVALTMPDILAGY